MENLPFEGEVKRAKTNQKYYEKNKKEILHKMKLKYAEKSKIKKINDAIKLLESLKIEIKINNDITDELINTFEEKTEDEKIKKIEEDNKYIYENV